MKPFLLACYLAFFIQNTFAQLRINEVMSSNGGFLTDADGDASDWIELFNNSDEPVNLKGYGLSDKYGDLFQWVFPDFEIPSHEFLIVFASGKDRRESVAYWNTIINQGDNWKYLVPSSEPLSNWRQDTFNDGSWQTGPSGFGYGDSDDATLVTVTRSIFLRKKFIVGNVSSIRQLVLHMDYDDGFVAYLNGLEIARSEMDGKGDLPRFDETASGEHEALIYQGYTPEMFFVNNPASVLKSGENILAIQVHNVNTTSSDLSAIPFLSIGTSEQPANQQINDLLKLKAHEFHTNFKISADGESVYLTNPTGSIADSVRLPSLSENMSYGRSLKNQDIWSVYSVSTPGSENNTTEYSGNEINVPVFSSPGGIYSGELKVSLSTPDKNDKIFYTTDGSEPNQMSKSYSGEITINESKVIRARVINSGSLPGKTLTNSYIIYYNKKLPVVSISMNPVDLWDFYSGIYVSGPNAEAELPHFGANYWMDWERSCHFEMMETTGDKVIDVDAGTKIYGNWSRADAQKSMAFYCRKSYGAEFMKHKIFQERPFDEFKDLVLRNSGSDWNESMFRDGLMTGLMQDLNVDYMAFRPATVFLNGDYWGILNIREKINEHFIASNHNVDPDKVILLENNGNLINGSADDWWTLFSFLEQNSLSNQANYEKVVAQIDLDNFTNYVISEIFFRNHDWPGNNIKYWKTTDQGSRWRWIMYDTDFGMGIWWTSAEDNSLAAVTATDGPYWPNPPWSTLMLRRMLENNGYRNLFVNRFADLMNSTFTPDRVNKAIDQKRDLIKEEMPAHLSMWNGGSLYDWQIRVNWMKTFASTRPSYVFSHIREKFSFQQPQTITVRADSNQGSIQLNSLNLSEFPWSGKYFPDVPVTMTAVPLPGYRFVKWLGVTGNTNLQTITIPPKAGLDISAIFETDGSHYEDLVINEISFNNNALNDPGDWIEIYNKGNFDIDISGWKITDSDPSHQYLFAANSVIKAKGYLVVVNDLTKFKSVFGSAKNLVEPSTFNFGLSSTVDAVKLYSRQEQLIDEVNYTKDEPWPTYSPDELWSLELISPFKDNNSGFNWVLSEKDGTPGSHNRLYFPEAVEKSLIAQSTPELLQNYPNPFADGTYLEFKLEKPGKYVVSILDLNGRIMRRICGDTQLSTVCTLYWDGNDDSGKPVASGVYFYRLECTGFCKMKRMVKM